MIKLFEHLKSNPVFSQSIYQFMIYNNRLSSLMTYVTKLLQISNMNTCKLYTEIIGLYRFF